MSTDSAKLQSANDGDAVAPAILVGRTRQLIRELPVPPELAREIEAVCKKRGFKRGRWRDWMADELTLQYYYARKIVARIETDRGPMVLAVGDDLDSPEIAGLRDTLTREENARTSLQSVWPLDDDISIL